LDEEKAKEAMEKKKEEETAAKEKIWMESVLKESPMIYTHS
jgi:hypothetical protein